MIFKRSEPFCYGTSCRSAYLVSQALKSEKQQTMDNLIYNFNTWVNECDPLILRDGLAGLIEQSGYTVLNKMDHHFSPQGYTCLWLLAESHLAVHTFPENGKTYIELSSCNKEKNETFKKLFVQWPIAQK